jgi:hypothetical protein
MRASTLQHEIIALLIFHHHYQQYIANNSKCHVKETKKKKINYIPYQLFKYMGILVLYTTVFNLEKQRYYK